MVDHSKPPKGLAGTEWLYTFGARAHERLERATSSTSTNPEMTPNMRHVAAQSRVEPKSDKAEPWQFHMRLYVDGLQKAFSFDPTRMLFYSMGRPCVVHLKFYKSK